MAWTTTTLRAERFLDKGLQGMMGGEGFYKHPNPAYSASDFLTLPAVSPVPDFVSRILPK
jgi:hypothetical protein